MDASTSTPVREACASAGAETRRIRRRLILAAVLVGCLPAGAAFAFQGPPARGGAADEVLILDRALPLAASGVLQVVNPQGPVEIRSVPGEQVRLRAWSGRAPGTPMGRAASAADLSLQTEGREIILRTVPTDVFVHYQLDVPARAGIDVRTGRGDIRVTGIGGRVRLEADSGRLVVRGVTGFVEAGSVNGDIEIAGPAAGASANTVLGNVLLAGVRGEVRATCISGNITMETLDARDVSASSTGGDIRYAGGVQGSGRYVFSSHSGDIHFDGSGPEGLDLGLSTFSGSISLPLDLILEGDRISRRSLRVRQGAGGANVEITAFSGNITIRVR